MISHMRTAYQISSKRNHSRQSYDVISISKIKIAARELKIHPGFGFSDSTRLAMSKSISTPNVDKVAQSTAVLLLLLIWENGHPPYWNYTSGFEFTYWSSLTRIGICIDPPNLKYLAPTAPEIWRVSQNIKK